MRPQSIILFERIYLATVAIGVVTGIWSWLHWSELMPPGMPAAMAGIMPVIMGVSLAFGIGIDLLLWYFIARRGSNVAKWIFILFFALAILGVVRGLFVTSVHISVFRHLISVIELSMQAVCVWLVFRPDTTRWFRGEPSDDLHDIFS
jgi:hypothetical protein